MELKIYDKANNLRLTASPNTSSSVTEEIGGECSVSASFTHTEYIPLDVDDYIELEGVRYKVKSRYRPKQKNTQTYEYSVKFYAPIHDAEDTLMLFQEGGTTSEFSYDGGPREHLQLWIDNMNRRAGGNLWSIGTVITADNKTIDYRNVKCWDAAFGSNGIAATFETEMWADGYAINLCKAERGEMVELGYLQGLTNLAQEDNGEVKFFTRLFPLGSTRNIDATKYGYSRLQLPDRSIYVDKNVDLYGVKEETEETAFSEIYPKYIGTVSSVRTEEKTSEEGRKYTVYYFKDNGMNWNPKDYEIPDLDYMLKFQTGELAGRGTDGSFQAAWHEDTREWEIINVYPDDTTQIPGGAIIPQPGDQYIPWNFAMPQEYITEAEQEYKQAVDDYLNTYSFDPNKYTGTTDRNYIEKNHTPLHIGWNVRLLSDQYFGAIGGYKDTRITKVQRKLNDLCQATITCSDEVGTGWKSSVDNSLDSLRYEVAKQAEQYVYDIIKSFETKTPSDNNVFSALKSLKTLLRKDQSDSTNFLLKLLGGAEFGVFASGISGANIDAQGAAELLSLVLRGALTIGEYKKGLKGANIDEQGVADLLSILVRSGIESANFSTGALGAGFCLKKDENGDSYLEVDRMLVRKVATFIRLLIQQIKHVGGQIILTPASMSCVKIEDKGDFYRCYFENTDGERTIEQEFVVGDLARAQTFNVKEGVNENVTNTYYWRAVVGTGDNYIDLSKTDCDTGSTEPKAGDDIVQLGNKSDATRQAAIILSAYGNDAPYFKLYRGINSYSLDGKEFASFSRSEVMIIADAIKFSSGESVKDYIDNAVGEVNTKVDDAISDLSENISFVNQLSKDLEAVKNQIDGAIETWFYEPVPTLSNEPAVNWTTNEDKNVHLGDLYYDGNGKAYRFQMSDTSYVWQVITDSDITKALADAKKAQDTADGKRRVFVTTPSNASVYDIGDLWVNATYGSYKNDLLRCKTAKQANAQFSIEHWELASKYTDDTKANQAQAAADAAKQAADSAQQTANNAVQSAATANALLSDIANDNKLTAQEKQETKKEWDIIVSEKPKNNASADKYGVSRTAYDTAYNTLSAYITPLLSSLSTTSNISGAAFRSKFKDYYDARTDLLNAISAKAKSLADAAQQTADAAQEKANQAIKDAANAKAAADNAQSDADEAKSRLDSWASDGSISPTEKQSLKEEIARIDADKTQIANGYSKYNLGTPTNYNNAHTTYRAVLVTLTASSPETIAIPSDFSTKQTAYYTQRTNALTAISNAARDYAQGIANDLSSYKKTVSSQFGQTNNSITAAVTSSKEYTNNAINNIQIGGRNLIAISNIVDGYIQAENGNYYSVKDGYNYCSKDFIPAKYGYYTLTLYKSISVDRHSGSIHCYDSSKKWLGICLPGITWTSPKTKTFQTLETTKYIKFTLIKGNVEGNWKLETGTKSTDWSPAPEDSENALTEYKKEVTSQFSVLEGEINSKVSSTEITTIKQEIINTAASDATKKANDAKTSAISTASADATSKANKAKQDAISTAGQNADKKYATITTVKSMQTVIEQHSEKLLLKAEKSEVTTVQNNLNQTNNNLSALTTRVSKAEVALQPDNIWIGISSKLTSVSKITNIVPDSCFDDANYSLLYTGGSRVSAATANNSCPTSYCMKSTQRDVQAKNYVSVAEGEKYYISAYVNAQLANHTVTVGLILKKSDGTTSWHNNGSSVAAKTSGWRKLSGYITIPAGYTKAGIWFQIDGGSNFGSAYFTKVYAYKVDSNRNNLALNSKGPWTANKYQLVTYLTFVQPLTKGAIYTVSWKGSGTGSLNVYFSNGVASSARQIVKNGIPVTANSNYQGITFFSERFKLDPSLETDNGINLTVKEVKVEEGERATDWCYSDGDYSTTEQIKTGITVKENAISIFGKDVSLQGKITFSSLNSSLQSTINNKADSGDVTSSINSSKEDLAKKLGYANYSDMVSAATAGNTIIEGGHIRTSLIEADALVVKTLNAVNAKGINTLVDKEGITLTDSSTKNVLLKTEIIGTSAASYAGSLVLKGGFSSGRFQKANLSAFSLTMSSDGGGTSDKYSINLSQYGLQVFTNSKGLSRPRILWCGYISSSGIISREYGNYTNVSVRRNSTGTYTVTHNLNISAYYVLITPKRDSYFPIACVKEQTSTYFKYATAYNALSGGIYGLTDGDCSVFIAIIHSPSVIKDA
ncbi:MAG: hypothetical protein V8T66_11445 [Phocaeicola sp.]|uniref:hypothetical protein n=1 Tax=Phocaeicola sp. TaxID=2773926 RepID=UPI00300F3F4C